MNEQLEWNLVSRAVIGDVLRKRARDSGPLEAIVDYTGGVRRSLTFRQLNAQVNRLVAGLRGLGLVKGDRLGLLCGNGIEFLSCQWACFKSGIVMVPLNYLQAADDIAWSLQHAGVRAVIVEAELWPGYAAADGQLSPEVIRITANGAPVHTGLSLDGLMRGQPEGEPEDIELHDRDPVQIMYTSGTTSKPKGVVTSNLALLFGALGNVVTFNLQRPFSQLCILPQFHCAAQSINLMTLLCAGRLISMRGFDAARIIDVMEQERVSSFVGLPMMWRAMLALPGIERRDFSSLQRCSYAMAPMDVATLQRMKDVFRCEFDLPSGQTEYTPCPTIHLGHIEAAVPGGNCWGEPTAMTDQAILDDEGRELPLGEIGEICWRGPAVMSCYFHNDDATREARKFGWHHSGDLGYIDACGQLQFVDRKKDIIKSGGENVASAKVEEVLLGQGSVAIAAAIGVPHPRWSEAVVGVVQAKPGVTLDEEAMLDHCAKSLGGFQRPKRVIVLEQLPLTATGKVRKAELRKQFAELFAEGTDA